MRTGRIFCMLIVSAIALTTAGCGGAKSGTPKAAAPLSKAAYVREANSVCRDAAAKSPPFPGKKAGSGYNTTADVVIPYLEKVHAINKRTLARLHGLPAPTAQKAEVAKLIAAQQARVNDLEAALAAAQKKDGNAFTAAFQRDQKTDAPRYYAAAAQLGLSVCSGQSR